MSSCCTQASPPIMLDIGPTPEFSPTSALQGSPKQPTGILEPTLCSVPPSASREVRVLLTNLRDRQEQLFELVLDQQRTFQIQWAAMHSAIKAISIEKEVHECDQHSFAKMPCELSPKSHRIDVAEKDVQTDVDDDAVQQDDRTILFAPQDSGNGMDLPPVQVNSECRKSGLRKILGSGKSSDDHRDQGFLVRVDAMLLSKEFEIAIAAAIMVNSVIMFWECQYQGLDVGFDLQYPGRLAKAQVVWAGAETVFSCFDWFFGCLFTLEMIMKIVCWRYDYVYRMPDNSTDYLHVDEDGQTSSWLLCLHCLHGVQAWNLLDAIVVVAFLIDKMASAGFVNPQLIRVLRLFRLGRLLRLLRFLESLDNLYVMTTAISGLKNILAWAVVLLTLILLTCDLCLVQLLQVSYFNRVEANDLTQDELQKYHLMYSYFGTATRCMLSMFELSLGNWYSIARLLSEEISEWFAVLCILHQLTIGFAVVGVINGCILQETFKVAQTDDIIMYRQKKLASQVLKRKMEALFDTLDLNQDGKMTRKEFTTISALPEIKTWLASLNFETDDLHVLFDLIDVDNDDCITPEELVSRMPRLQGHARSIDVLAMQRVMWKDKAKALPGHSNVSTVAQSSFADFMLGLQDKVKRRSSSIGR